MGSIPTAHPIPTGLDSDFYDPDYPQPWHFVVAAWLILTMARAALVVWRVRWWLQCLIRHDWSWQQGGFEEPTHWYPHSPFVTYRWCRNCELTDPAYVAGWTRIWKKK